MALINLQKNICGSTSGTMCVLFYVWCSFDVVNESALFSTTSVQSSSDNVSDCFSSSWFAFTFFVQVGHHDFELKRIL